MSFSWMGPISFALYAPGHDFNATMDAIQYARLCLRDSKLIRDYVTFHIYFPKSHMPDYGISLTQNEALKWPINCKMPIAPYTNVNRAKMYKNKHNLTYPINVGRNIARSAANTHFIFACDIELYPSLGLIDQFLDMIERNVSLVRRIGGGQTKPRVFPVPVFEVQSNATVPSNKAELVAMLKTKTAIPFHKEVCSFCHLVPEQDKWVEANDSDTLEVFAVTKREGKFIHWEPFYISDNTEPLFDERVTWEGQSNKRIQNYAMCLLNYEYHVLHPAFLVHAPGIKKFNPYSKRLTYVTPMNKLIATKILPEFSILYGINQRCSV